MDPKRIVDFGHDQIVNTYAAWVERANADRRRQIAALEHEMSADPGVCNLECGGVS
jgi:hypothetical protein